MKTHAEEVEEILDENINLKSENSDLNQSVGYLETLLQDSGELQLFDSEKNSF